MTTREFIDSLLPRLSKIPVLKSLIISQICLESAFGRKHFYNNYLGIKCHNPNAYAGCRLGKTSEVINGEYQHGLKLAFQTYNNIDECIEDYVRIMNLKRYKPVRDSRDYLEATEQVRACGYATSLTYRDNLRKIIEKYKLYKYDMQLTKNFNLIEFYCQGIRPPDEYLDNIKKVATELQKIRDYFELPVIITSSYRTKKHNQEVNGSKSSFHLKALAADIKIKGIDPLDIFNYAKRYTKFKGFGISSTFNHLDLRDKFTLWWY